MAESKKSGCNPFDGHYTNFEQSLALSWAQAHLCFIVAIICDISTFVKHYFATLKLFC